MHTKENSFGKGSTFPTKQDRNVLRLYSMRFCPFAYRTRLVLEAKGVPYETININLKSKPDWFLALTPMGTVPVIDYKGAIVYDSLTVNDYLDDVLPGPKLNPTDPLRLAEDRNLVAISIKARDYMYSLRGQKFHISDDNARDKFLDDLKTLEEALCARGEYYGGATPMMVDYNVLPWIEKLKVLSTLNEGFGSAVKNVLPRISAWIDRMYTHAHVRAADVPIDLHIHFMISNAEGKPDYDAGLTDKEVGPR